MTTVYSISALQHTRDQIQNQQIPCNTSDPNPPVFHTVSRELYLSQNVVGKAEIVVSRQQGGYQRSTLQYQALIGFAMYAGPSFLYAASSHRNVYASD